MAKKISTIMGIIFIAAGLLGFYEKDERRSA